MYLVAEFANMEDIFLTLLGKYIYAKNLIQEEITTTLIFCRDNSTIKDKIQMPMKLARFKLHNTVSICLPELEVDDEVVHGTL